MANGTSLGPHATAGLLSTRSLVNLYKPDPAVRSMILDQIRPESYRLTADGLPDATVRDQRPLKFLDRCLLPGTTVQDFLDALNGRVFFHVAEERLHRLLGARAYRSGAHDVFTIDTEALLESNDQIDLAPYNTGSVHVPNMPARGPSTFTPLVEYPWERWRAARGEDNAVVELTVANAARVENSTLKVERWAAGERLAQLFP